MNDALKAQIEAFKANPSFSPSKVSIDTPVVKKRSEQSTYFGFVLYPEDPNHVKMLEYIKTRTFFKYVYILHDKDFEEDQSTLKKPHYHVMIKTLDRLTPGSVVDWFGGWVNHAECIHSPKNYIIYMLHGSPKEFLNPCQHVYDISELHGHEVLWKNVCVQNSHFVQLKEILRNQPYRGTFMDTFNSIPDDRVDDLGSFMWENRFFVQSILKEEANRWVEVPIDHECVYSAPVYSSNGIHKVPSNPAYW